ncbi:hypothetical protein F2P56_019930 [Juglans regia]|uniref:Uncharacterized protein n=1 Tax=Juglans regia TaxID=51240 RepID=A0A833XAD5_JUGRE|nr:hypothetical protein F2P56_019930 [Juglans regia]
MLLLISVKLPQQLRHRASPIYHGHLFSTSSLKPISEPPNSTDPKSLTVSFLRNSCGLSLELATLASKKLNIENIENPNSVLNLLRTHGLTQNHIIHLISSRPLLLSADLGNTPKPNMELFKSLWFSGANLAKMLTKYPIVLDSDAYTAVDFFRAHGFSDMQIKTLIMKYQHRYSDKPWGSPDMILKLMYIRATSLLICSNRIREIVSEVMKLGFDPNYLKFVLAIKSMTRNSKTLLEQKVEDLRSFGLSDDEICLAFKRQPLCMGLSEKKIKKMMGFFVNKLKMKPSRISKSPILLLLSLEKRIIPRCSVLLLLMLEGLIKEDTSIVYIVKMAEKNFVKRFVSKYQNEVPDVRAHTKGRENFKGSP